MSTTIYKDKIANDSKDIRVTDNGIMQIDISGVLDGADVATYILDSDGNAILVRDFSWMTSKGDALTAEGDGAVKYLQQRVMRFVITNAGGSTNIDLSISNEAGNIIKI